MQRCSNCGTEVEPGARFCAECGATIVQVEPTPPPVESPVETPVDTSTETPAPPEPEFGAAQPELDASTPEFGAAQAQPPIPPLPPLPPPPAPPAGQWQMLPPPGFSAPAAASNANRPPKSFIWQSVVTLILYTMWLPGLIANIIFWNEANQEKRATGRDPAGKGCLLALFIVFTALPIVGGIIGGIIWALSSA